MKVEKYFIAFWRKIYKLLGRDVNTSRYISDISNLSFGIVQLLLFYSEAYICGIHYQMYVLYMMVYTYTRKLGDFLHCLTMDECFNWSMLAIAPSFIIIGLIQLYDTSLALQYLLMLAMLSGIALSTKNTVPWLINYAINYAINGIEEIFCCSVRDNRVYIERRIKKEYNTDHVQDKLKRLNACNKEEEILKFAHYYFGEKMKFGDVCVTCNIQPTTGKTRRDKIISAFVDFLEEDDY